VDVHQQSHDVIADFAIGHRIGRYDVVDVAWGLGFIVGATVSAVLGSGDPLRSPKSART
jgi:steroid 5-alpha reductase family enzyme